MNHINATNSVARDDGYIYVNLRLGGFAVVYLDPTLLTLSLVDTVVEPGV